MTSERAEPERSLFDRIDRAMNIAMLFLLFALAPSLGAAVLFTVNQGKFEKVFEDIVAMGREMTSLGSTEAAVWSILLVVLMGGIFILVCFSILLASVSVIQLLTYRELRQLRRTVVDPS